MPRLPPQAELLKDTTCTRCGGKLKDTPDEWLGQAWHRILGQWYCACCIKAMATLWVAKTKDKEKHH